MEPSGGLWTLTMEARNGVAKGLSITVIDLHHFNEEEHAPDPGPH